MRNLVVAIGPAACGKTEVITGIKRNLVHLGLPVEPRPLSDGFLLVEEVLRDDREGGWHHFHPWCPNEIGHRHSQGESPTPFTVRDSLLGDRATAALIKQMKEAPGGKIHLVEMATGANLNPDLPEVDFSCERLGQRFKNGELEFRVWQRALLVVHPKTTWETRLKRNETRRGMSFSDDEVEMGEASFYVPLEAMRLFGKDDFEIIRPLLEREVPLIFEFDNNQEGAIKKELERASGMIESWLSCSQEGALLRKERLF